MAPKTKAAAPVVQSAHIRVAQIRLIRLFAAKRNYASCWIINRTEINPGFKNMCSSAPAVSVWFIVADVVSSYFVYWKKINLWKGLSDWKWWKAEKKICIEEHERQYKNKRQYKIFTLNHQIVCNAGLFFKLHKKDISTSITDINYDNSCIYIFLVLNFVYY